MNRMWVGVMVVACVVGCGSSDTGGQGAQYWSGVHAQTLPFGSADNSEVIKALPGGEHALLVASKSRKVTLLGVGTELVEVRSHNLFLQDGGESELTHVDVAADGRFAALTRTLPTLDGDTIVDCAGSVVFIDSSDSD